MLLTRTWQVAFTLPLTHPRDMPASLLGDEENGYLLTEEPENQFARKALKALPHLAVDPLRAKGPPSMGVSWTSFSPSGALLAAREDSQPRCLWVFDAREMKLLSIIISLENIVTSTWRPGGEDRLAFATATSKLYFWRDCRCPGHGPPVSSAGVSLSSVTAIEWSSSGDDLVAANKDAFVHLSGVALNP